MVGIDKRILRDPPEEGTKQPNEDLHSWNIPKRPCSQIVCREKRSMKALHLDDNWVAFSAAMEERFTDHQETGKDHKKLLALKYSGDMQTYLARFNKLNSCVQLSG